MLIKSAFVERFYMYGCIVSNRQFGNNQNYIYSIKPEKQYTTHITELKKNTYLNKKSRDKFTILTFFRILPDMTEILNNTENAHVLR